MHTDINELNKKIDRLATSIIGTPIKTRKASLPKQDVSLPCPVCENVITYKQRPSASSVKGIVCTRCSTKLVARWSSFKGFTLSVKPIDYIGSADVREVPQDIVEEVKKALPEQPWPKGTGQQIAKDIGISNNDLNRAVDVLIKRGDFKVQVDGVLYEAVEDPKPRSKKALKRKHPLLIHPINDLTRFLFITYTFVTFLHVYKKCFKEFK